MTAIKKYKKQVYHALTCSRKEKKSYLSHIDDVLGTASSNLTYEEIVALLGVPDDWANSQIESEIDIPAPSKIDSVHKRHKLLLILIIIVSVLIIAAISVLFIRNDYVINHIVTEGRRSGNYILKEEGNTKTICNDYTAYINNRPIWKGTLYATFEYGTEEYHCIDCDLQVEIYDNTWYIAFSNTHNAGPAASAYLMMKSDFLFFPVSGVDVDFSVSGNPNNY